MMRYLYSFLILLCTASCQFLEVNHYHDGIYQGELWDIGGQWLIKGNEIIINNDISGTTKVTCQQFKDRIEYKMADGTVKILSVLDNGDLKYSDMLILEKVVTNSSQPLYD